MLGPDFSLLKLTLSAAAAVALCALGLWASARVEDGLKVREDHPKLTTSLDLLQFALGLLILLVLAVLYAGLVFKLTGRPPEPLGSDPW